MTDGLDRLDPLPEQVARVEIDADSRAGGGAQLQHGVHVVDQKSRMRLERYRDAVVGGEPRRILPVGNRSLLPLPVE